VGLRVRTSVAVVLSAGITALTAGLGPVTVAYASHNGAAIIGGFEIDGNFAFDGTTIGSVTATRDWANVGGVTRGNDAFSPAPDDIFTGGSKENDPAGWSVNASGSAPGKVDLTRVYYAADVDVSAPKAYLWLGFERLGVQGQGDAHVNFEMNQAAPASPGGVPPRSVDDLLIVYDYDGGSDPTSVTIEVRQWTGSAWSAPVSLGANAKGDVNGAEGAISRPDLAGSFPADPFEGGTVASKRFGEVGLNLLGIFPSLFSECLSFTSFWAKSRASGESFNAELKDKTPSSTIPFDTCPNVSISKTTSTPTVTAGGAATYSIGVTNDGAGPATGVTLTDVLPAGLTWTVGGPDAGACAPASPVAGGTTLTCSFGTVNVGATKTVTLTATTSAANCPSISNTATVSASNEPESSDGDNSSGPVQIAVACPDVGVVKITTTPVVTFGDSASYSITVTAGGTGDSTGVTLTDVLPAGLDWTVGGADAGDCSPSSPVAGGTTLTCDFGTMSPQDTRTITLTATTTSDDCVGVQNTATVSAGADADETNNSSGPVAITVNCPDVEIHKTTSTPTVTAGGSASYSITVTAGGTGDSTGVTLTDVLPAGLDWTVGGADAGDCSPSSPVAGGTTLTCDFGTMSPQDTRTITLTATTSAQSCPSISNTATVSADADADESNNSSGPVAISVSCPLPPPSIGIDLVKTGPDLAHVGDTVTYTLTVRDVTSTPIGNVVVSDPRCDAAPVRTGGDTNANNVLEAGEVWTYTCSHVVVASDPDPLPNTSTVNGTSDGREVSDTDSHVVDLVHPAISIVKTAGPVSINPGGTVTYTYLVTNTGDTTLFDVSVDDDKLGHIGDVAVLVAGGSATLTKAVSLVAAVTNVGTAAGSDVLGRRVQASDDATVTVVAGVVLVRTGNGPVGVEVGFAFLGVGLALVALSRRREPLAELAAMEGEESP
jgi:uncharacterized repeat protein (TIGR01451 family)